MLINLLASHAAPQLHAAIEGGLGAITLYHYLFVAMVMFALGVIGFLARRNLIIMFLSTELMFQGAGLALIAFSRYHFNHTGEVFVIFVLTVAAAEAALALALVVLLFRQRESLDAQEWSSLQG
ncbi:MAG: NADH-quinone oxidoreductase subunit NuoK [Phycisphaerales bacterium]|nr:NADH-quinone oxidoreductase subunit NuoK [Phycisphaerales bacterium]